MIVPDVLANLGGVTVSYFEWLKNLDHISPGRITKRQSELRKQELLKAMGYNLPKDSPLLAKMSGGTESDIVRTGMEDMIETAVSENWQYAVDKNLTLRDACYGKALEKMALHYEQSGMMG